MNTRKPARLPLGDTEYMLEQWGFWRLDGMGVPSYVSPAWALMRDVTPSSSKSYVITDELAGLVDGAVARLCRRDPQMGDFVWLYYAAKWPAKRIGAKHNMCEAAARQLIKTGVGWIDCALERFLEAA
ncbi:antitermination protein Q [Pseudomonas chlororaphis]|uniref:antiterminator Q family protein n=1 Tax=Pseudomonas chlororaphis TaxID=587753 RepID=UPI000F489A15|nr:antiterminator Q family protein [Pseudomonas chlororaphis]ROL94183.1 antitermination protein Q [Pseudomonas chlororaphis]